MLHETFHLKKIYPALADLSNDPTLTTYLPYNLSEMGRQDQKHPAVLLCPGGGYLFCSQREDEPIALKLLSWGYRVFILNYSCTPCHFPAQLCEVAAAMDMIHKNAEAWHIDVNRIAIMGFSAGGHLAGHYSNSYNCPEVRAIFPDSKAVAASILCYPVITAEQIGCHVSTMQNLTGHTELSDADIANYSVEKLVTEQTPPAFIWHTAADDVVPVVNSLLYAQALAAHGVSFALHIYPHGRHGLSTVDTMSCEPLDDHTQHAGQWLIALKDWLEVTL
ncbi:MAG: alpha/beta hydrolase [Oscillospiraceae bacterium]|nr:alpha/beta hydrolase [Oscillospiraceae bacterium]